ncbi:MAG: tRNA (N6-isopentenyl adenosine(37)-C2)-methylthiotransferase MiaB [Kiritimatiellae bacterium]|nr:tRNA (N6-isopentenyl adenosine(37)-C2)-methylthiotransferase MiaB [Kiritimatiellia bacterium]
MRFFVITYGCQMNERDTDAICALLLQEGHEQAESEASAELVIVNTCSVRARAEEKALGKLRLLASSKGRVGKVVVGAIGCMVQRMGGEIFRLVPGLDFAVGTYRLDSLPAVLQQVRTGKKAVLEIETDGEAPAAMSGHAGRGVTAFVNILLGCNRCCSYCIVPFVRGRERSRPAREIIEEVECLVEGGVREVTLLGQRVMAYGQHESVWKDVAQGTTDYKEPFPRLLSLLSRIPGLKRLRFTSGHPSGCTEELARAIRELPPVCEHIHLPLQSGADRILEKMRRGYNVNEYRKAVTRLREAVPDIAISTDVIVGFPSETVEEFEKTRSLMDEIGFDNAFVFKYSPRPGTLAACWADDVPFAEKLRRNKVLLGDQERRSLHINKRLVGHVVEVLVEGPSRRNPARWTGRTRTNKIVVFERTQECRPGDLVGIRVENVTAQTLYGALEQPAVALDAGKVGIT